MKNRRPAWVRLLEAAEIVRSRSYNWRKRPDQILEHVAIIAGVPHGSHYIELVKERFEFGMTGNSAAAIFTEVALEARDAEEPDWKAVNK